MAIAVIIMYISAKIAWLNCHQYFFTNVESDYLVVRTDATSADESNGSPTYIGYKMSRDGAQKLWSVPEPHTREPC